MSVCYENDQGHRVIKNTLKFYLIQTFSSCDPLNRLIRPVGNSSDRLTVKMGLKLSQIIGIDMKRQILITNVWVEQEWVDYKLMWNPEDYGGVKHLHVPSQNIWLPDIVLYNK